MSFIEAFVDRSRATIAFLIMVVVLGIFSYMGIAKESTPDVKIPIIYLVVTHQGISPEDAERLIARPLENELSNIDGIKKLYSYSYEGSAVVLLEFHAGFDSTKALRSVRDKVQDTKSKLPRDSDEPIIEEINLSLEPVLSIILGADIPERTLLKIARDLKDKLIGLPGVLDVKISGNKEDTLEIIIPPEVLDGLGLSVQNISQIIDSNNRLVATGAVRTRGGDFSVKMPSLIKDYESLLNFPVKVDGDKVVKLGDIAQVRRAYKDNYSINRVNGKPSISIHIVKKTGENLINTVALVKEAVEKERKFWPEKIKVEYSQDKSHDIKDMIVDLENNIIIGIMLVVIVVIMSVGTRSALLISLSIPTSFFAGILLLDLFGLSLNVVVLFSLILTIGMIVDDAIVVSEYADRLMLNGASAEVAFIQSAKRMLWPIVTSTLVKIVVFLPLLFWPGVIGQFMVYMPITVIAILGSSLIFALFFQPTLGPLFGKPSPAHADISEGLHAADHGDLEKLTGVSRKYKQLLELVLSKPKKFVLTIVGSMVLVNIVFALLGPGLEFFPKIEPTMAVMTVQSPGNLSLHEKDMILKQIEERVANFKNEIKIFEAEAGDFTRSNNTPKNTIITAFLEFENWKNRRKAYIILGELTEKLKDIPGITFQFIEAKEGPPADKPIQINVTGRNPEKLTEVAASLIKIMRDDKEFIDVEDSRDFGSIEWQLIPDRIEAARYGVDVNTVGNLIRLVTDGLKISTYRPDDTDDEVDILLRFPKEDRSVSALNSFNIINSMGQKIPISNIIERKPAVAISSINKINKEQVIKIKANVPHGVLVDSKVRLLKEWVAKNVDSTELEVRFAGEDEDMQETSIFLRNAFVITLFMMFMIMLIQFNNIYHTLVIMSAVFLSTIGVLLGLLITYQPFGVVMCGIGIIALGGIVLNNNILFVDTYQHLRRDGMEVYEAIIRSGVQRMRPIVLTATTAILGLLPMVFGLTINFYDREISYDAPSSQWWRQLSASIAGGLAFATILTLFFTPCLLLIGKRFDRYK